MGKKTEALDRKFNLKKVLQILVVAIIVIVGLIITIHIIGRPYDATNNTFTKITISEGDDTSDIASKLNIAGIIGEESTFKTLSKIEFKDGKYKPGSYLLSPCMNFTQITNTIITGITTNDGFTIPAGYTLEQTVDALDQAGFVKKNDFYDTIKNVDFSAFEFIEADLDPIEQLEGFLYPDTYTMDSNANPLMVITTMLDKFDNNFTDEYRARAEELGLSIRDVIIIASIIEKETTIDKERDDISAVIHNRINLGMKFKDGYPNKPLCSPGIKSIKAALYPKENDNLFYVLSDKLDGSHKFVTTGEEYKKLLAEYKEALSKKNKIDKESENNDN